MTAAVGALTGAVKKLNRPKLWQFSGDAKHRPEARTSFIGQINAKNFGMTSSCFSKANSFTTSQTAATVNPVKILRKTPPCIFSCSRYCISARILIRIDEGGNKNETHDT